jgi:glucosylceramidase
VPIQSLSFRRSVYLLAICCGLIYAGRHMLVLRAAVPPTSSTPFTGTRAAIPGRIEAVNFDNGGQGVAYFDTGSGNSGGAYRATDVDIETSASGGYDVGWVGPGEWLRYSVDVQRAGAYVVRFSVACPVPGGTFHLEMNGTDVTGPLTVPNTGSWQSWQSVTATVNLQQGPQSATLVVDADGPNGRDFGNFGPFEFSSPGATTPYSGTPAAIPGTIEAVNFDNGSAGSAYADVTAGNSGGVYRGTDVDIEASSTGGFDVGWVQPGEWLAYTVAVGQTGNYTAAFRIASPGQGGRFHLEVNGVNVTGPITLPSTGGWQSWQTVSAPVSLTAGTQIARLVFDAAGSIEIGNFKSIQFTPAGAPPPPPPPPASGPYSGSPVSLPGVVEAVNFDNGPSGTAYSDATPGNTGGAYRSTDVDIEPTVGGGFNVGWTQSGEWMNYTVNVASAGGYSLQLKVATAQAGRSLHVGFNGPSSVWTQIFPPSTGGWQAWTTVTVPVTLGAGVQQMTVYSDTGSVNLGPISVTKDAAPPPPPPPPPPPVGGTPTSGIWLTDRTGAQRLAQKPSVQFVAGNGNPALPSIDVNESVRYQQIEGFGGSLTDAGAWVLSRATAAQQSSILAALFDRQNGIGLTFLRQPIGSSDFSRNAFTYDDIYEWGTDYNLASFSIEHDRAYILPLLRAARSINPAIKVMASPWTPPAWMKTEGSYGGTYQGGSLRTTAFDAYASYLVKFIQGYQAEGVPIDSLTVQNEPLTTPPYPSMYMLANDQATFIGQNLGPALDRAGLRPRIFTWDHNWDTAYPSTVLSNASAARYVSGVAFHCYGGQPSAMSDMHNAHPNVDVALTECSDGPRATFGDKLNYDVRVTLIGSLRNWARSVSKWNLVLDENGGPKLYSGACLHCTGMVTVNGSTGGVSYNEDYYAFGHASRFIQPGAYRIDSTAFGLGGIENVAVQNPDGSLVVLAINSGDTPLTFQIRWHGQTLQYTLDYGSAATFVWPPQ